MATVKVYVRMAENQRGMRVESSTTPNYNPLSNSYGETLPTAMFALNLEVPKELFRQAEKTLADVEIKAEDIQMLVSAANP